ncbi:MAG TPA: DUF1858 domain-containing protein [bacterium]
MKTIDEKIKADMKIGEILKKFPETAKIFHEHRMDCLSCSGADTEHLSIAAVHHGKEIEKLLVELNEAVKNSKRRG